ncbi:MAG: hypothetical protein P0120_19105 [Nitrospira sp.]|nr:hypothetical protein [Nitrospira sp.]
MGQGIEAIFPDSRDQVLVSCFGSVAFTEDEIGSQPACMNLAHLLVEIQDGELIAGDTLKVVFR